MFTQAYAEGLGSFAANLRAIHCPEETVQDIIVAEVTRRHEAEAKALIPKPADHVPYGWSAGTSEAKLIRRRLKAAQLAREETAQVREALGYDVWVQIPNYAMTAREQEFEEALGQLETPLRIAVRQVHEDYWGKVQALEDATKGFWQEKDLMLLQDLKLEHRERIKQILEGH